MTISTTGDALVEVLSRMGVNVTTVGDSEIGGHCPVHVYTTGREDGSPSWSMNSTTGLWICYSCGARGNLPHLVSTLTEVALEPTHQIIHCHAPQVMRLELVRHLCACVLL